MSRRAEMLAIGSELLEPWAVDTNGSYLALRLGERGIALRFRTVVGDAIDDLTEALRVAIGRSDLILATGGLGPTVDDRTREAVAALLGLPMAEDPGVLARIEARFQKHALAMPEGNRRQAMVPRGAEVLPNRLGTAPGLRLRAGTATLVLLPGVPAEMRQIMEESVLPGLEAGPGGFARRVLRICGPTESEVDARLAAIERGRGEVEWTILAREGQIEIHLRETVAAGAPAAGLDRLEAEIARALGADLFGRDGTSIEEAVGRLLVEARQTLALAESVTGGAVARRVAAVQGASRYFRGGVVCYSDESKVRWAGVHPETLAARTAVSLETASEMAEGVRGALGGTWGLATVGYAGPGGGPDGTPAGTVMLALSGPSGPRTARRLLPGDRRGVQARAAIAALDLLRRALLGERA